MYWINVSGVTNSCIMPTVAITIIIIINNNKQYMPSYLELHLKTRLNMYGLFKKLF